MGIKIQDVAYVRFSAPDLNEMETFLTEFGMVRAERSGQALHMRGLDQNPFLHVTHLGEPAFLAAGFKAASMEDLERLAREEKATIDPLDGAKKSKFRSRRRSEREERERLSTPVISLSGSATARPPAKLIAALIPGELAQRHQGQGDSLAFLSAYARHTSRVLGLTR
jgi:hypothetical protein